MTCNPLIGQTVHYVAHTTPETPQQTTCRPATITAQYDATGDFLNLHITTPNGTLHNNANHSNNHQPGTWHWPPAQTLNKTQTTPTKPGELTININTKPTNDNTPCHECGAEKLPLTNYNGETCMSTEFQHEDNCSLHPNNIQ